MSLLDTGREQVIIYPMVPTPNPDGGVDMLPSSTGTVVRASVQPLSATNDTTVSGQASATTYRVRPVRGQHVPVGPWACVEWLGRTWDVDGEPSRHNGSDATAHIAFRIRARTSGSV